MAFWTVTHLLTVILAPGSEDSDCQRDVSFLLFISSFLRDAAECKSAFSPCGVGGGGGGVSSRKNTDGARWEVCDGGRQKGWKGKGCGDGGVIRHVRKVWCVGPSRSRLCLCV